MYTLTIPKIKGLYTTQEAAEFLGITVEGVRKQLKRGKHKNAFKLNRGWIIPEADLLAVKGIKPGPKPKK